MKYLRRLINKVVLVSWGNIDWFKEVYFIKIYNKIVKYFLVKVVCNVFISLLFSIKFLFWLWGLF